MFNYFEHDYTSYNYEEIYRIIVYAAMLFQKKMRNQQYPY